MRRRGIRTRIAKPRVKGFKKNRPTRIAKPRFKKFRAPDFGRED